MKRIFTKPVFMRASVMLLMTMLTSVGAWAQASMLMTDTEEPLGSAARHYVLMPVNANQEFVIPTDGNGRPVDGNGNLLRSFKLYDDGGKGGSSNWTTDLTYPGNYNPNNSCGLQITAPEGYRLYINGRVNLVKFNSVSHRGEYRDDYKNVANEEDKFTTWFGYHSFNESSTGRSVTFWLTAYPAGGSNYSDSGFDLTITVFKDNETYNVNTASALHGTVTTDKTTANFFDKVNMTAVTPADYYESNWTYTYIGNDNTLVDVSGNHNFFRMPNSDVTFTKMFKPIDYTINYTNDDGTSAADGQNGMTNANPTTYNVETPNITLIAPKRFGYTFAGWYNNAECTGSAITGAALPVGSHGDQTFYAKWTQNSGTIETITSETAEATINDNITVTGTGGNNTRLKIADGATVTIKNLTVTVPSNGTEAKWPGIECLGDATIILEGTNSITINAYHSAGIFVPSGKTLTIQEASAGGTLSITSYGPGIGSNDTGLSKDYCGNIIINGGTFTINSSSVGIGANGKQACGDITINGGTVSASGTATGIGAAGNKSSCGNITIANTVNSVTVNGGIKGNSVTIGGVSTGSIYFSPYVYNPSAVPVTITFDKGAGSGTMEAQTYYSGIPQNLNLSTFTAPDDHLFYNWSTQPDGNGETYLEGQLILPTADMTLYAQYTPTTMTLASNTGSVRLVNGMTLTGTGGKKTSVSIADGATVTFNNVTIPNVTDDFLHEREYAVQCEGNATIFFEGTNEVDNSSRQYYPALFVPENKTLTIIGTGSLTAKGGDLAPGIGSRYSANGGHIVINYGTVIAIGGEYCAGIGSSRYPCGDITIANTVTCVTATAGSEAPNAIGSTDHFTASSTYGTCGTITIGDLLNDETSGDTRTLRPYNIVSLADNADNTDALDDADTKLSYVTLNGRTIYKDGKWNTLCLPFALDAEQIAASPLADFTIKELDDANSNLDGDGKLTLSFTTATEIEAGKPYIVKGGDKADLIIKNKADWNAFCQRVNNHDETFEGKLVILADDYDNSSDSITWTVGLYGHPFKGTFDGNGRTLTVGYNTSTDRLGPFRYVDGATIKNLTIAGRARNGKKIFGGLVGSTVGNTTISNCRVSATIESTVEGDGTVGGFIGIIDNGHTTIENCLFDGIFEGTNTTRWCGFVGWVECSATQSNNDIGTAGSLSVSHSLFAPTTYSIKHDNSNSTVYRTRPGYTPDLVMCFYRANSAFVTTQGYSGTMNNTTLLGNLGSGWEISSGKVVPKMVSNFYTDIVNPKFKGVTIVKTDPAPVAFTGGSFKGNYNPFAINDANRERILLLSSGNKLGYAKTDRELGAFRAYFEVPATASVRSYVLNFSDEAETATGIISTTIYTDDTKAGAWYMLDGRRLSGKPTKKGLYIVNGKTVVVK